MLKFSPRARQDIEEIWDYTVEHWGQRQAEIYLRLIRTAAEAIASDPKRGRTCDDVRPGYRRYEVGSHVLFYRMATKHVIVIRILHQRMDVERHI